MGSTKIIIDNDSPPKYPFEIMIWKSHQKQKREIIEPGLSNAVALAMECKDGTQEKAIAQYLHEHEHYPAGDEVSIIWIGHRHHLKMDTSALIQRLNSITDMLYPEFIIGKINGVVKRLPFEEKTFLYRIQVELMQSMMTIPLDLEMTTYQIYGHIQFSLNEPETGQYTNFTHNQYNFHYYATRCKTRKNTNGCNRCSIPMGWMGHWIASMRGQHQRGYENALNEQ